MPKSVKQNGKQRSSNRRVDLPRMRNCNNRIHNHTILLRQYKTRHQHKESTQPTMEQQQRLILARRTPSIHRIHRSTRHRRLDRLDHGNNSASKAHRGNRSRRKEGRRKRKSSRRREREVMTVRPASNPLSLLVYFL